MDTSVNNVLIEKYDDSEKLLEYNKRLENGDILAPYSIPSYDEEGNEIPVVVNDESKKTKDIILATAAITPRNVISVTGSYYENGESQTVTANAAGGVAEYVIYHRAFDVETRQWSQWYWSDQKTTAFSYTYHHQNIGATGRMHIQYGVAHIYSNGTVSGITGSGTYRHHGTKKWNGNAWEWGGVTHRWDGNSWIDTLPKKWTGTAWQYV